MAPLSGNTAYTAGTVAGTPVRLVRCLRQGLYELVWPGQMAAIAAAFGI